MNLGKSASLYSESERVCPGGVSSPVRAFEPHPVFMAGGRGCRIADVDGNEYVDMCMAYGPLIAGHACRQVIDAAAAQLSRGTVFGCPSEPELALAQRLCRDVPSMDMVRLAVSGTEATMHAIRLARGYTGRNRIVKMNGGFHGAHDAVLVKAGSGSTGGVPGSLGVPEGTARNTLTAEYNDAASMEEALSGDDVACVIMEPVLGNVGVVPPEKGYLEDVRRITREHGTLLLFDEVITGARLSPGGAQSLYGVTPDMTTMGKIIGGGFAAGAFGGRRDIMEMTAPAGPVYAAGTFAGNPVSAAAGLAQLDLMASDDNYAKLDRAAADLVSRMRDSIADRGAVACVQSVGSMYSVFFGRTSVSNGAEASAVDRRAFDRMFRFMLDKGVYLAPSALEVGFLSVAHDREALDLVAESFDGFLKVGP